MAQGCIKQTEEVVIAAVARGAGARTAARLAQRAVETADIVSSAPAQDCRRRSVQLFLGWTAPVGGAQSRTASINQIATSRKAAPAERAPAGQNRHHLLGFRCRIEPAPYSTCAVEIFAGGHHPLEENP
jgi:hypothetical protein